MESEWASPDLLAHQTTRLSTAAHTVNLFQRPKPLLSLLVTCALIALGIHAALALADVPLFGDDAHLHLDWIDQFVQLRAGGITYPRLLPLSFAGLGATTFYFYPPLPYFLASVLYQFGIASSASGLYHALQLLSIFGSLVAMYGYLRHHTVKRAPSFVGATLYAISIYHFVDIFYRNSLSEQFAFVWLPLIFLGIDCGRSKLSSGSFRSIVLSAIAWWGLVLTNIPMFIMAALAALVYVSIAFRGTYQKLWRPAAGSALAGLMAAFYLLPLRAYSPFLNRNHLTDYVKDGVRWGFVLEEIFHTSIVKRPEHLLLPVVIVVALISVILLLHYERKRLEGGWAAVGIAAIVLQLPLLALPLWDAIPPLQLLQFSWRLCALLTILPCIAFVSLWQRSLTLRWVLTVYMLFTAFWYVRYVGVIQSNRYEAFHLSDARFGAPEYVPTWADKRSIDAIDSVAVERASLPFLVIPDSARMTWQETARHPYSHTIRYSAAAPATAGVALYYWPYWRATLANSSPLRLEPDSAGFMTVQLPAGDHSFTLSLASDPAEEQGRMVSIVGFSIFAVLCVAGIYQTAGLPRVARSRVRTTKKKGSSK